MKDIRDIFSRVCPKHIGEETRGVLMATLSKDVFTETVTRLVGEEQLRLALLFGTDDRAARHTFGIHALLTDDNAGSPWLRISADLDAEDPRYPSLTTHLMSAYWYERYLHDMFGITPVGHPDLRRLVHHENIPEGIFPLRKDFAWNTKLSVADVPYPMLKVDGGGVFEVPVGPIHAGIIEPGHFRFSVAGERIIALDAKLFFTHKGVEKLLEGKTPTEALPFIERISGDMSAAHADAFCRAVESIGEVSVSTRDAYTRALLTELERITMHIHDIANIGGMGTGFALISSRGFAIKERMVRLSEKLCANRFWRGMIRPGGVVRHFSDEELREVLHVAEQSVNAMLKVADIALSSEAFKERLETTGKLSKDAALAYGALGIAARGSGVENDARVNHAYGAYQDMKVNRMVRTGTDIMARFMVRLDEIKESLRLVALFTHALEKRGDHSGTAESRFVSAATGFGLGVAESWRGEIAVALILEGGKIVRCVVRDPSFVNWQLFGELSPGNILPDFPLCNKSLNLSYSGTDM